MTVQYKERRGDANVCVVEMDERTADHTCRHAKDISALRLIVPTGRDALPTFNCISTLLLCVLYAYITVLLIVSASAFGDPSRW